MFVFSKGSFSELPSETSELATPEQAEGNKPALRISGRVLDAETGKPIKNVRMVPTMSDREDATNITWQSQYLRDFTDGSFLYETDRPWEKTRLRIEAEGYQPAMTRIVNKGEVAKMFVKLQRKLLTGVVRLPNGRPAGKAQVALATWTNEINVKAGKLSYSGHGEKLRQVIETAEQGRFVMPAEIDPSVAVVAHAQGYAEVANAEVKLARTTKVGEDLNDKPEEVTIIQLKPWGRVEGRVLLDDKPVVGAKYWVYQGRSDDVHVWANTNILTDADGRFVVEQIPPGRFGNCQRIAESSDGQSSYAISGLSPRFEIPAGETVKLEFGGRGRTLIGKLAIPQGFPYAIDWSKVTLQVSLQHPRFRFNGIDESSLIWSNFLQTDEGKQYAQRKVAVAADGSFRIEGLLAAEYDLTVIVDDKAVLTGQKPTGHILQGSEKITVSAVVPTDAVTQIDLGTIKLKSTIKLTP